jgi:radical SAM protein with 4Fe4S-binding SPASM domain
MTNIDPWYNSTNSEDKLGYISLAILGYCNLNCIFCYVDGDRPGKMEVKQIKNIIDQCSELGLEKIQLTGGEPLAYPTEDLREILEYLNGKNISTLLVTNATLMTEEIAYILHKNNVNLGISFESIDPKVHDELNGSVGAHDKKMAAIGMLKEVGYTKDQNLNIIIKTMKQNYLSFNDTWKWAIDNGIQPVLDRAIPGVRCKREWVIEGDELENLMKGIGEITGTEQRLPFNDNEACNRWECGFHIDVSGDVNICGGVPVSLGNVNEKPIKEIWKNNDILKKIRNLKENIKGYCKICEEHDECTGCRGVAYAMTGDMFESDMLCWKYDKNNEKK